MAVLGTCLFHCLLDLFFRLSEEPKDLKVAADRGATSEPDSLATETGDRREWRIRMLVKRGYRHIASSTLLLAGVRAFEQAVLLPTSPLLLLKH